jgi:putative transposase
MISYKYPIFPDKVTKPKLVEALDACRCLDCVEAAGDVVAAWLYNRLLQEMNDAKERGIKLKTYDTQNMIPSLKLENPKLNLVYSKVLQMVNYTLWSNIKGLSASKKNGRKVGHVRFKGHGWYKTMNYNQSGFKLDQDHGRLHLSKIGDATTTSMAASTKSRHIKIKMHRKVQGCIKAVLIKREGRQWFAIVQADQDPEALPETGKSIGLDVGLKSFVVDTDSNSVENPRFAEKAADKLAKAQKRLARAERGSNNRQKIKEGIEKIHIRVNHQRDDFLHKLSRSYVNNYDNICIEDLDVKGLKEKGHSKGMHRNIHDASWSRFMFMLFSWTSSRGAADGVSCTYKAASAGRKLIKVDPRNTTQKCSACGSIVKKELSDRVHECPYCGFSCDRDYNASRNILIAGAATASQLPST